MKYPAILKNGPSSVHRHQVVIAYSDNLALHIEGLFKGELAKHYDTRNTVNITHEYLQNKKVKVESQEHLEFLYKLSVVAGYEGSYEDVTFTDNYPWFAIVDGYPNEINEGFSGFHELEKITIPLPPKAKPKIYPQENLGEAPKHFDCVCNKCGGKCCAGQCDEWPCVGSIVTWGNKSVKGEVKALSDGLAWIKNEYGSYCNEYISSLQKPKTPEEELRDELEIALDLFLLSDKPTSEHVDQIINLFKSPNKGAIHQPF